jgi:hypothetical protein
VKVPEHGFVQTPAHLTDVEAATLPIAAVTAWHALFEVGRVRPGDTVLFFSEAQVYYVPFPAQPDHLNVRMIELTTAHPDPDDMLAALRAEGADYLLVNEANIRYAGRWDPEGRLARARATFAGLTPRLEQIYRDGPDDRPNIVIYRVPEAP